MYITITLVMMRKMISILFLVLVLLISLGLSQIINVSEGMETEEPSAEVAAPEMEKSPDAVDVNDIPSKPKADMVSENDDVKPDVVPMEGGLTENMSNYR
jgi:hypothetical protein